MIRADDVFCAGEGTVLCLTIREFDAIKNKTYNTQCWQMLGHSSNEQKYSYDIRKTLEQMYPYNLTLRRSGCPSLDLAYVALESLMDSGVMV